MTTRSLPWFLFLLSPIRAQVRRNLEYHEKNGVTLQLVTPDMFQADAVDDLPANNYSQCQVFMNASDFMQAEGIAVDCNHIGWLDEGDWLAYSVPVSNTTTIYNMTLSVTSPLGEGSFRVEDYETQEVYATVDAMAVTDDWNSFSPVTVSFNLANATNDTVTVLIRSLSMGWTFHDLCFQEVISNATIPSMTMEPTTTEPVTTVPTVSPQSSRPTNSPTLLEATETILPTQMATTMAPTVMSSEAPTKLITTVPAVTTIPTAMPSSLPTLLSEMPSDVLTIEPTIAFATTSTVVPTTYAPSMSDYPSASYEYSKKSKKSQPSGKGSNSGKGGSGKGSSGKGSSSGKGAGKGSSSGKGSASYGKGSSVSGKGSSRRGKGGSYGKGKGVSGEEGIESGKWKGTRA